MEQRLFLIACIMYSFTLITRFLNKKHKLECPLCFAWWHAIFWFIFVFCAGYMLFFVSNGGESVALSFSQYLRIILAAAGASIFVFFKGKKASEEKRKNLMKYNLDWSNTVYFAGFVASIIMFFFIQAFKIPSASMRYTLVEGDHLFVNKAAYGFRIPLTNIRFGQFKDIQIGDIIILRFPAKSRAQINCGAETQYGRDFVKRVVALPGDTVQVIDGHLWVNGVKVPQQPYEVYEDIPRIQAPWADNMQATYQEIWENHLLDNFLGVELRDSFGPVKVPDNNYFVMGDNRDNSCDSRFWGPVPRENIKGKAWFVHWPLKKIHLIK